MKSKHDYKKKYSVFDKVRMEMPNWTGYNAELLDELVEIGNELLVDNEHKEAQINEIKSSRFNSDFTEIAKFASWICLAFFCIFGMVRCAVKEDDKYIGLSVAYKQGQVDVLTGEKIVYESTIHGYKLKPEFNESTRAYATKSRDITNSFTIKDGDQFYNFYLKE